MASSLIIRERTVVWVATVALCVGMFAVGEFVFADSWFYAGGALAVAVVALAIAGVAVQWRRKWRPSAPTNTQLQQPPPAIIQPAGRASESSQ